MYRCASGEWINLQYMESIKTVARTDSKYNVELLSISGENYLLRFEFESEILAEKYIDDLLTALFDFN